MDLTTLYQYHHWQAILQRGQDKVTKQDNGPAGRAELEAEFPLELRIPIHLQPRNRAVEKTSGPTPLPPCLVDLEPVATISQHTLPCQGHSFLSLPPEIRGLVYQACVNYPTCWDLFDNYYGQRSKQVCKGKDDQPITIEDGARIKPRRRTPTIFLLCKQITREALDVLRTRLFVVDRIPPWIIGDLRPLPLSAFISRQTLQKIRYLELRVAFGEGVEGSGSVWVKIIKSLLKVLAEHNSLIDLKVMIKLNRIDWWSLWLFELPHYERLIQMLDKWQFRYAGRPDTIHFEHWVIHEGYAFRTGYRNPLIRFYPDSDIWPGSILEFLYMPKETKKWLLETDLRMEQYEDWRNDYREITML